MSGTDIRLDKWLWAARFYKTRAIAKQMIQGGKVCVNGYKPKSGKTVCIGDVIQLKQGHDMKTIVVDMCTDQRKNATEANRLYHETEESIEKRKIAAEQRKTASAGMVYPNKRPDKKERRNIHKLKRFYNE